MRIAAGILMIMYGVKGIGTFVGFLIEPGFDALYDSYTLALSLIVIISAVFFTTGGVFCLKRKYWKICFGSSLCFLLFVFGGLQFLLPGPFESSIPVWVLIWVLSPVYLCWGILSQIFVCLRKSEWQEISA